MIESRHIQAFGSVDDHDDLYIRNRKQFNEDLRYFRGKQVRILVMEDNFPISDNQREYIFGCMAKEIVRGYYDQGIVKRLGEVIIELKDDFLFLEDYDPHTNELITTKLSLSPESKECMNRVQFLQVKDRIQQHYAETLGIDIPDPQKEWKMYE